MCENMAKMNILHAFFLLFLAQVCYKYFFPLTHNLLYVIKHVCSDEHACTLERFKVEVQDFVREVVILISKSPAINMFLCWFGNELFPVNSLDSYGR